MNRPLPAAGLAAVLVFLCTGLAATLLAEAGEKVSFESLEAKQQKTVCSAARAYFDPNVEFLWRPRKEFRTALEEVDGGDGYKALADIAFLKEVVYQGRHFLPSLTNKQWLRDNEIEYKRSSTYHNLKSEKLRLTFSIPRTYPKANAFDKIPRGSIAPMPLLLSIHEDRDSVDTRGQEVKFPGEACLKRRFPKATFGGLYDNWLLLAPVATRAKFLEKDDSIRHRILTMVLTKFWRRYHVDFDRIIVDGAASAAALAASFPHVFAGLVLRNSKETKIETEVVRNYASVPVFVVGDPKLAKALKDAGHPNVTEGSAKDVAVWINSRKRVVAKSFKWAMLRPDHKYANWITIDTPDYAAPERILEVEVLDVDDGPNTVKIKARGIEQIRLHLNDDVLDLDRDLKLVVNGQEKTYQNLERDFGRLFDKDPYVRKVMNFGWLYPTVIERVRVPEPPAVEETPPEETPPEDEGVKGTPEEEKDASDLWTKGVAAEAEGNLVKARLYFGKVVAVGTTSFLERAKQKLEELTEDE